MIQAFIRQTFRLLLLLAVQVMVLNHVHIFGYATPLICVYFILLMPLGAPRWTKLLWAFATGVLFDMFANTPGMMAATLTLVAMIQPHMLTLIGGVDKDDDDDENTPPTMARLGKFPFMRYITVGALIQCIVFYLLETFSFFSITDTLINIVGSTVLSTFIIWVIQSIREKL